MRIAQVSPLYESVPPKAYGGTERVVSYLTEELVARGHDVTLFASGDSVTRATLRPGAPQALRLDPSCRDTLAYHVVMLEEVARARAQFDLVHFHTDYLHFGLARRLSLRHLTTLHGRLDLPELSRIYREYSTAPVVSISNAQRAPLPQACWLATVLHGLPRDLYPFREVPDDYLAFLGRISPEKGLDHAIAIASRLGVTLRVAAKIDREDRAYYETAIAPLLKNPRVEFIGEISDAEKAGFLGGAKALLFPIDWPEPFGLVLIEAMACGTPVVAYRRGSVPEIIVDGENGFLVDNVNQAVAAVDRVRTLSRHRCRQIFEARFTARRMADDYLTLYAALATGDAAERASSRARGSGMSDPHNEQGEFYILATEARPDERTRVLKHGETFAVFDRFGDLPADEGHEYGLYHGGTRFLSRCELRIGGQRPMLLSSTVRKARPLFTTDLTTPDVPAGDGTLALPKGVLHVLRTKFLWEGVCHERLHVANHGQVRLQTTLTLRTDADFADVFEVRGAVRERRGRRLHDRVVDGALVLGYEGLDAVLRQTTITCEPAPAMCAGATLTLPVDLAPGESTSFDLRIVCERGEVRRRRASYASAFDAAADAQEALCARQCRISSSSDEFNEWLHRSSADLTMMMTDRPEGLYPYAGVPWFSAPFGRDGIIAALQFLWVDPMLAKGVLGYLASTQADGHDEASDAQPGKILHEARDGEMAELREVPFARYYGSVDATPLFVMLAGAYYDRTGDRSFVSSLWPHIARALVWMNDWGDADRDGFVEYERRSANGLVNQGWKDSGDAISHNDGSLPEGPMALCEVQGYVYAARRAAARVADALGLSTEAHDLRRQAEDGRDLFLRQFWMPDLDTYALALDGRKHPCRVRASNAGHCLYTGIASPDHASRLAGCLADQSMHSGWGIRTLATGEVRYNPMSYHNGSVWPHDNAIIAMGLAQYGLKDFALTLFSNLFEAAMYLDLRRMPELFCGFLRRPGEGPTLYPIACLPQAWAAASVFMIVQAVLGLQIDGVTREVTFTDPVLPPWLQWLRIERLTIGDSVVDLLCERHAHDVGISLIQRTGDARIVHVT